jgi:hypothetical protein
MKIRPKTVIPLVLAGMMAFLGSGCCSSAVVESAIMREKIGDVTGAYKYHGRMFVAFPVHEEVAGTWWDARDLVEFAFLTRNGKVARRRSSPTGDMTNSPLQLVRLPENTGDEGARRLAEAGGNTATIYWWHEDSSNTLYFVYFVTRSPTGQWNTAGIRRWDTYVPLRQYPKLIFVTPLALTFDIITAPIWIPLLQGLNRIN